MQKAFLWFLILSCVLITRLDAGAEERWCAREDMALETSEMPIQFSHLTFNSQGLSSFATVHVKNAASRKVAYYLIAIELFDGGRNFLITLPFFNVDAKTHGEVPFTVPFNAWLYGRSSIGGASTGETILHASSPSVVLNCPASACVAMVQLKYDDGGTYSYAAPDLSLDPIIVTGPFSDARLSRWALTFASGKLLVDPQGHGKLTEFNHPSAELFEIMQAEVGNWTFSVPLRKGKPTSAQIGVLFYVDDAGAQATLPTTMPAEYIDEIKSIKSARSTSLLVVVHAYRWGPAGKGWAVKAGDVHVESLDVRQR